MFFQNVNWLFPVLALALARWRGNALDLQTRPTNTTLIAFQHIDECERNEFYDLDYFQCTTCGEANDYLQATADKFSCECTSDAVTIALFNAIKNRPICESARVECLPADASDSAYDDKCHSPLPVHNATQCSLKSVNYTAASTSADRAAIAGREIRIRQPALDSGSCHSCNLAYNFHYNGHCIGSALLTPHLKYDTFWQTTSAGSGAGDHHYGTLKFVAFFCLTLHNSTACQQLANLCVMSHFSFDNSSPCSAFLLTQATDVAIKYASMDDHVQAIRPFLFYKRGKQTAKLLAEPVTTPTEQQQKERSLQIFHTIYALDGTLQHWGHFSLQQLDFCQLHAFSNVERLWTRHGIRFAQYYEPSECWLTLANMIDLARLYANNRFVSLHLNISRPEKTDGKVYMQAIPILIQDLSPENSRPQPEDWQLVKRFQMIEAQSRRFGSIHHKQPYEADAQLQLYRSIRYVEHFELHYDIHDGNRISVPVVKLRYRRLELSSNVTLDIVLPFKLHVTFARVGESTPRQTLFETLLPTLLLLALVLALLRLHNYRQRRPLFNAATTATTGATLQDLCGVSACLRQFLLQLLSNVANAFLLCFLLYVVYYALRFLTQHNVEITLPIMKTERWLLQLLICAAFGFKFTFLGIHCWHITHIDMFLIDWERPRSYDNNHFNLKNNLETSSVCSSVRTFASENGVSAWRVFFTANEWIRLSAKQKHSAIVQGLGVLIVFKLFASDVSVQKDVTLQLFVIILASVCVYCAQQLGRLLLLQRLCGDPLQKFVDLCTLANVSVFILLEHSYGFYIHGRSPSGFADTDMYSIIVQLQRESQHRCSRKGLLGDSDQQSYIMLPPTNLRNYYEKLLAPFQRTHSISQAHFQKEINSIDATVERNSAAYSSLNRFLCAFIDHAIKDMDYIIKEKTFIEKLCNCEFDNYLTENKGTFYIDRARSFGQLCMYGNDLHIFALELSLLLMLYMLTTNLIVATVTVCLLSALLHCVFLKWVRQNVAHKTSIDRRFLM